MSKDSRFSTHVMCYGKIVYNKKTNKYRLIDATLTPGEQMWSLAAVVVAATYSDEVQATTTTAAIKNNIIPVWE